MDSDREFTDEPPDAGRTWAATEEAWSQVAPGCKGLIAVSDARHAYAVLRGLTSANGGMVAGRHHVAAGAARGRAELRLPVRVDQGPVLRRPGRRRARPAPGSGRPARAGNWVRGQFQLDALGETLSLLAEAFVHAGMLECAVTLSRDAKLGGA